MIREILIYPDPVLKKKCEPVPEVTEDIKRILSDMQETMLAAKGAGLAASQIGFPLRLITILVKHEPKDGLRVQQFEVLKLVNPKVIERRGSHGMREGCLSLPGYFEMVQRSAWVKVEAQDEEGHKVEVVGDGFLAHVLQHEIEHLDGIVFIDHFSPLKRSVVTSRFKKAKARGMRYAVTKPEPRDFTDPVV